MMDKLCKLFPKTTALIGDRLYRIIDFINRIRLKRKYRCIISNNCNGGLICKSLKQRYNSPTVGLSISIKDIIRALNNYDYFFKERKYDIKEVRTNYDYPVVIWGEEIIIRFIHYGTFEEAYNSWCRRIDRVRKESIYVILTCTTDDWSSDDLKNFEKLEYKKIILTNNKYNIKDSFYIKGNESDQGIVLAFKRYRIFRYIDQFDYVKFLNK